jgi:hypothetical protein
VLLLLATNRSYQRQHNTRLLAVLLLRHARQQQLYDCLVAAEAKPQRPAEPSNGYDQDDGVMESLLG